MVAFNRTFSGVRPQSKREIIFNPEAWLAETYTFHYLHKAAYAELIAAYATNPSNDFERAHVEFVAKKIECDIVYFEEVLECVFKEEDLDIYTYIGKAFSFGGGE